MYGTISSNGAYRNWIYANYGAWNSNPLEASASVFIFLLKYDLRAFIEINPELIRRQIQQKCEIKLLMHS